MFSGSLSLVNDYFFFFFGWLCCINLRSVNPVNDDNHKRNFAIGSCFERVNEVNIEIEIEISTLFFRFLYYLLRMRNIFFSSRRVWCWRLYFSIFFFTRSTIIDSSCIRNDAEFIDLNCLFIRKTLLVVKCCCCCCCCYNIKLYFLLFFEINQRLHYLLIYRFQEKNQKEFLCFFFFKFYLHILTAYWCYATANVYPINGNDYLMAVF